MTPNLILTAEELARSEHIEQKYGELSYMYHINQVVNKTSQVLSEDIILPNYNDIVISAYLHDIVEDTRITLDYIKHVFGTDVSEMVCLVTDPSGKNRKERKNALYTQFKEYPYGLIKFGASVVKLSDRYCNQFNSLITDNKDKISMYKKEFYEFMDVFGSSTGVKSRNGFHNGYKELNNRLYEQYYQMEKVLYAIH